MATAAKKQEAPRTRTRVSPALDPASKAMTGIAKDLAKETEQGNEPEQETEDTVMTSVATGFTLTLDDGSSKRYEAGACRMPRSHAEHWFAVVHGTKIVK